MGDADEPTFEDDQDPRTADSGVSAGLVKQVLAALEQFHSPVELGRTSPLASPYFLGDRLSRQPDRDSDGARGRVLQELLFEAIALIGLLSDEQRLKLERFRAQLATGLGQQRNLYLDYYRELLQSGTDEQRLLYWKYLHHYGSLHPPKVTDIIDNLVTSRPMYHRWIKQGDRYEKLGPALARVGAVVVREMRPTLRHEAPLAKDKIIGRAEVVERCLRDVGQSELIAIIGPGGIGKTTLGAELVRRLGWPTFWFTFRPGLNDSVSSLLFSLSHFLQGQGAGVSWAQLIADEGQVQLKVIPNLVRHDLASLTDPILLIFDEVDLIDHTDPSHTPILALLQSLQRIAPVVCIGQQIGLDVDHRHSYVLDGLTPDDIAALARETQVELSPEQLARLHRYTLGNPRLVRLVFSLHVSGESLDQTLTGMAASPSIESLLLRVWQRLREDEHEALKALSIFRSAVPEQSPYWSDEVVTALVQRHLVQRESHGGIALLPAFRQLLYGWLDPDERKLLHLGGAQLRADYGEYTAAAYHLIKGEQPGRALALWDRHRTHELNQGQGEAALALFRAIAPSTLSIIDQERLSVVRSELLKLVGDYPGALEGISARVWASPQLKARARRIMGDIAEVLDDMPGAQRAYEEGLATMQSLLGSEIAFFHKNLAWVALRQDQLEGAWREACLARYEAQNMQGYVKERLGEDAHAIALYEEALRLAAELEHVQGQGKTLTNLARVLTRRAAYEQAAAYLERADRLFQKTGDTASRAVVMLNQALSYNLAGYPDKVIPLAEAAQRVFDQLGEPWGKAVAAQNLAEAYQALGDLDQAEQCAWKVVQQEERATLPDGLRVLGEIYLARGEPQRALTLLEQSVREARENKERFLEGYAWRSTARAHCALGDLEQAVSAIIHALTLFQELDLAHEVEKSRGGGQELMHLADTTIARCKEEHNLACEAGALRAVGRLLVALGANDEAREALERAVALYKVLGTDDEVTRTKAYFPSDPSDIG